MTTTITVNTHDWQVEVFNNLNNDKLFTIPRNSYQQLYVHDGQHVLIKEIPNTKEDWELINKERIK